MPRPGEVLARWWVVAALVCGLAEPARAHDVDATLVQLAVDAFPRIVAVDLDLKAKLTPEGRVHLLVLHHRKVARSGEVVERLRARFERIASLPVVVDAASELPDDPPTAILIVERFSSEELAKVVEYSIAHHILVFSPFEEDVRRGVTAGMAVEIRVVPLFNRTTLERAKVRIHPIVLASAKFHD